MANSQNDFGHSRDHNRHFVIMTSVILVACLAALYVLNSFGYFGLNLVDSKLTEDYCLDLFSNDVDVAGIGFIEYNDNGRIVKESSVLDKNRLIRLGIETEGENIRCSISARENSTIFRVKGIGSSEYMCDDIKVSYSGGSQDGYYYVIEEIELPKTSTISSSADKPEGESGIPEVDSQLQQLPEQFSGDIEFDFGEYRYLQTITYSSNNQLYGKTLEPLRSKNCPDFFELISQ